MEREEMWKLIREKLRYLVERWDTLPRATIGRTLDDIQLARRYATMVSDEEMFRAGTAPPGWQKVGPGQYVRSEGHGGNTAAAFELREAYEVLEVKPGSTFEEVKSSYRRLVGKYHPDRFAQDPKRQAAALDVTRAVNAAWAKVRKHLDQT